MTKAGNNSEEPAAGGTPEEEPRLSDTQVIAVARQDNGELVEDVVEKVPVGEHERQILAHVVTTTPAPEVAERADPSAPVPGTLPRS